MGEGVGGSRPHSTERPARQHSTSSLKPEVLRPVGVSTPPPLRQEQHWRFRSDENNTRCCSDKGTYS